MDVDDHLTDRRGLLRRLAGRVADGANELRAVGGAMRSSSTTPESPRGALRAQLPDRAIGVEEVVELARAHGLTRHVTAVRRLSRVSVRLAPAPGGAEARPPLLARIDLAEAAAVTGAYPPSPAGALPLPPTGTLSVSLDSPPPSGLSAGDAGACRVVLGPPAEFGPDPPQLAAAPEVVVPRVWSAHVAALGLSDEEQEGWETLRRDVAAAQGVQPFDSGPARPIHRLLGWPDERGGWMPLASAMLAAGADLGGAPPPARLATAQLVAACARWRLLVQLSSDPALAEGRLGDRGRLYVWIEEDDLAAVDFSRVRAFFH